MPNFKLALLVVAALVFLIGCGDDYEDDTPYKSCSDGSEETFVDPAGDAEKKFVDLTDLKIMVGEDCVGAYITLAEMPPELTYNHSELPDDQANYQWAVYFDMDDDTYISQGDLVLSVTHIKFKGTREKKGPILAVTQDQLLLVTNSSGETMLLDHIHANIAGNTLHLAASKSVYGKLSEISASTKVKFKAMHNDGKDEYADVHPNSDIFE